MQSKLFIKDLELSTIIGLHAWELKKPQIVYTNIEITLDISKAATSDDIADSLNYEALSDSLVAWAKEQNYTLLEAFGMGIIKFIQDFHPSNINCIKLQVEKKGVVKNTSSCGIEIIV